MKDRDTARGIPEPLFRLGPKKADESYRGAIALCGLDIVFLWIAGIWAVVVLAGLDISYQYSPLPLLQRPSGILRHWRRLRGKRF